ncbi:MAG: DUF3147 family protein [Acidobacteriaceae bacterium]|jgi:Protein of unknown function (DUF3147)
MIRIRPWAIRRTSPRQYLARFAFGGAATVLAGVMAELFGPGVGGLFLAFPAIFPATVTLIEKHERNRLDKPGRSGVLRGRMAARIEANGAALGCMGLFGFALALWLLLPRTSGWIAIPAATLAWVVVAVAFWQIRRLRCAWRRARIRSAARHVHTTNAR